MSSQAYPRPVAANPIGSRRIIPFDHEFSYPLEGEIGRVVTRTVTVSIEGTFTAVAIGYGVIPEVQHVAFGPDEISDFDLTPSPPVSAGLPAILANVATLRQQLRSAQKTLISAIPGGTRVLLSELPPTTREVLVVPPRQITIGDMINALGRALGEDDFVNNRDIGPLTAAALSTGIRLNPDVARFFLIADPSATIQPGQLARLFETVSAPPDRIQFLYALFDEGTGREFQSDPILNIAGLGSADGERPFRYFAQPISFAPRTTIRLDITEKSEFKGELHVCLHGFKVLGGAGTPTGRVKRRRRT